MNDSWKYLIAIGCAGLSFVSAQRLTTAEEIGSQSPEFDREVRVPTEDFYRLLVDGSAKHVFLTREEFEGLRARAVVPQSPAAPTAVLHTSTVCNATIDGERVHISSQLDFDVLKEGLHAVPLRIGTLAALQATLDDKPAPLGRDNTQIILFLEGPGHHRLDLQLVGRVESSASLRKLTLQIPVGSASRLTLDVPGIVELHQGPPVIERSADDGNEQTRFVFVPTAEPMTIALSANNRRHPDDRIVLSRNVLISEIADETEHIHIKAALKVVRGQAMDFQFAMADDLEVISVTSTDVARWSVERSAEQRILRVEPRQAIDSTIVLEVLAQRPLAADGTWQMPKFSPLNVAGNTSLVGLMLQEPLRVTQLQTEHLIPLDIPAVDPMLPRTLRQQGNGRAATRPIAMYYAPNNDYRFAGQWHKPPQQIALQSASTLTVDLSHLTLEGQLVLAPISEPIVECNLLIDGRWDVTLVTDESGNVLPMERFAAGEENVARIQIRFGKGVAVGDVAIVRYQARHVPNGWIGEWNQQTISFPHFSVLDTSDDRGAIAVRTTADLQVSLDELVNLTSLDRDRQAEFGWSANESPLAFRFDSRPFSLSVDVERQQPTMTAETFAFYHVGSGTLDAHYEIIYHINEASAEEFSFALPIDTPAELTIQGLDGAVVKQVSHEIGLDQRRWRVQLTDRVAERVRLQIHFQESQPWLARVDDQADGQPDKSRSILRTLPPITALAVVHQTSNTAVEKDEELEVSIETQARRIDVGELAAADYRPLRRHFLGAFGSIGPPQPISVSVTRPAAHQMPTTIVERAELVTSVSAHGTSQTAARYRLRTKANFLEIDLPDDATLWSILLDDQAVRPQLDGQRLVLDLPATREDMARDVRIVYDAPIKDFAVVTSLRIPAPKLTARGDSATELPMADLSWTLCLPDGYRLEESRGTVFPDPNDPIVQGHLGHRTIWGALQAARRSMGKFSVAQPKSAASAGSAAESDMTAPQKAMPPSSEALSKDGEAQAGTKTQLWALQGLRSLEIDIDHYGQPLVFQSLGHSPILDVMIAKTAHTSVMATFLPLSVMVVGAALWWRGSRQLLPFIGVTVIVAWLLPPLSTARLWYSLANTVLLASCAILGWIWLSWLRRRHKASLPTQSAPLIGWMMLCALGNGSSALGQTLPTNHDLHGLKESATTAAASNDDRAAPRPIAIPGDAILVPYDPTRPTADRAQEQLMVPLDLYERLWQAAHPDDQRLSTASIPSSYAVSTATWQTRLAVDGSLLVEGNVEFDLFVDGPVRIPLTIGDAVLESATLNDTSAEIQIEVQPELPATNDDPFAAATSAPQPPATLHLNGKGHHRLHLALRFPTSTRGGWQTVTGNLPAAAATRWKVEVPDANTEFRFAGLVNRTSARTEKPGEVLELAPSLTEPWTLQWRPYAAQTSAERGLCAVSSGILDIQENGQRLVWNLNVTPPPGGTDRVTLQIPDHFLLEQLHGDNVQVWQQKDRLVEIEFAQSTAELQAIRLVLSRHLAIDAETPLSVPAVALHGAEAHEGDLFIRRSPMIELQTSTSRGLQRIDIPAMTEPTDSPLGVKPYQAYHFARLPYDLQLQGKAVQSRIRAHLQTILRLAETTQTIECRGALHIEQRPIHHLAFFLRGEWEVTAVDAPGPHEWSTTKTDDGVTLNIHLSQGELGDCAVTIRARAAADTNSELDMPHIRLSGVHEHMYTIAIQADPRFDVRVEKANHGEPIMLEQCADWLAAEQRELARIAWRFEGTDFSAKLRLAPREPQVKCQTISNVRVGARTFEETILLDFDVDNAGIREIVFRIPSDLAVARISVPLLREKKIEVLPDDPSWIRVRLLLQDDVMGQIRVMISHDRLLTDRRGGPMTPTPDATDLHWVAIPVVETGGAQGQFVTMENAGRHEVLIAKQQSMEPLVRGQGPWERLARVLGESLTQAYVVVSGKDRPNLALRTHERATVTTVDARVSFAETELVVDGNGAYRGKYTCQVFNRTEQFLEIELPVGSRLWTVRVAGHSVKPLAGRGAVRIPLMRTDEGDRDYSVEIVYDGDLPSLSRWQQVTFPFIRTKNVQVEQSHVRLHLPSTHHWVNFGGSMQRVVQERELLSQVLQYKSKQLEQSSHQLSNKNPFIRLRAESNVRQLSEELRMLREQSGGGASAAPEDVAVPQQAVVAGQHLSTQTISPQILENRDRLREFYDAQFNSVARNVVESRGENFDTNESAPARGKEHAQEEGALNRSWSRDYKLTTDLDEAEQRRLQTTRQDLQQADEKVDRPERLGGRKPKIMNYHAIVGSHFKTSPQTAAEGAAVNESVTSAEKQSEQYRLERFAQQLQQQESSDGDSQQIGQSQLPSTAAQVANAPAAPTTPEPPTTGLASLHVDFTSRGDTYRFTTPRGDVRITALAVERPLLGQLQRVIVGVIGLALGGTLWLRRRSLSDPRAETP